MATQPNWVFRLANTKTFEDIIEITQARNRQLQLYLNKPGSLSFDLPLEDSQTRNFFAVETCVKAYRNGELVWSGPVWTINDDASSNKTQIGCVGWFELLGKRSILKELQYTDEDAGSIAYDIYRNSFNIELSCQYSFSSSYFTSSHSGYPPGGSLTIYGSDPLNYTYDIYPLMSFGELNLEFGAGGFIGNDISSDKKYRIEFSTMLEFNYTGLSAQLEIKNSSDTVLYDTELVTLPGATVTLGDIDNGEICNEYITFDSDYDISDIKIVVNIQWGGAVGFSTYIYTDLKFEEYEYVQDIPVYIGASENTQARTKTYARFSNVGQEISSLSEIEAGFDFEVHPRLRTLDIYERIGDYRDVVFGYNWGPDNLKNVVVNTDSSRMVNRFIAVGQSTWARADEESKQSVYGLFDEVGSAPNTNDSVILGAYANAEIALRSDPIQTYQIEPYPSGPDNVPQPIDDYNIGDTVFFTAKKGNIQVNNQAVRIFGMSINIDDNGLETVNSIQTLASG